MSFLPTTAEELDGRCVDFVLITGDAYVDHASFGAAVIARVLADAGFSIGIIAAPDIKNNSHFTRFKKPTYGFLITSGNIDSMVNNYSVAKRRRAVDVYSPFVRRPDRALTVYSRKIRELFGPVPIVLGGLEASLRRLAHYDYWADKVMPSVLLDSKADLLIYGMGELTILNVAHALKAGVSIADLTYLDGTVFKTPSIDFLKNDDAIRLPDFGEISPLSGKEKYADSFLTQYQNMDAVSAHSLIEQYDGAFVVQNKPQRPLTKSEFDYFYELPYTRKAHYSYDSKGGIPALNEVEFSIICNRGCFGSCNFCALSFHQGRIVQTRSHESIIREAEMLVGMPNFKGYIHDVGGPTANFHGRSCKKQEKHGMCPDKRCLSPKPCSELIVDHSEYLALLRKLRNISGIKKVFVRSGIRFDYLMYDKNDEFLSELVQHHISGQLKVAPEHVSQNVLLKMGKPSISVYDRFIEKFKKMNERHDKKQFVVPYLMSSHPGATLNEAIELSEYLRDNRINPQQVQDFYPTPSQMSTCMYYTGMDPFTKTPVYSAKSPHEKAMQRALMQYRLPQNYDLVHEALTKAGRKDLIGFARDCLIRPKWGEHSPKPKAQEEQKTKPFKRKTIRNVHKKKH